MKRRSYTNTLARQKKLNKKKHRSSARSTSKSKNSKLVKPARKEGLSLFFFALSVFLFICLCSEMLIFGADDLYEGGSNIFGSLGENISEYLVLRLGASSFILPFMCLLSSVFFWSENLNRSGKDYTPILLFISYCLFVFFIASCFTILGGEFFGGTIGAITSNVGIQLIGKTGAFLISLISALFFGGIVLGVGGVSTLSYILSAFYTLTYKGFSFVSAQIPVTIDAGMQVLSLAYQKLINKLKTFNFSLLANQPKVIVGGSVKEDGLKSKVVKAFDKCTGDNLDVDELLSANSSDGTIHIPVKITDNKSEDEGFVFNEPSIKGNYEPPSLGILVDGNEDPKKGPSQDELLENCRLLERTLNEFKVNGKVVEVQPGPVITLYEFLPAPGVKVQKVIGLADDLALSLKVQSLRAYAPVPGKGTIGLEVPNAFREMVRIKDILGSKSFSSFVDEDPLPLAIGKDTFGESFVSDLAKMPHLLIAGATGTGKSVCINSLLVSLLYKSSPEELKLVLIDPKMLELSVYESIPHLASPVITNPKRAKAALLWAVNEMDRRYGLMKKFGVRSLAAYNKEVGSLDDINPETGLPKDMDPTKHIGPIEVIKPLPRVVIVIDELADLMLTVGKEIEELLTRLAQKARAAGIHMILATQRPSVNVITGLIKANFPTRISFQVTSKIDSRTILDQSGAEKLLGKGDMLFMAPGVGKVKRVHGSFISDAEVRDLAAHIKSQGEAQYDTKIEEVAKELDQAESDGPAAMRDKDELYDSAYELVVNKGHASTSMIQRAFRIGYNRAARILDSLQFDGVVGPADGAKPREILINKEDSESVG